MTLDEAIAADVLHTATMTTSCGCRVVVTPRHDEVDGQYTMSILCCTGGVWGPLPVEASALDWLVDGSPSEWRSAQTAMGPERSAQAQVMARETLATIERTFERAVFDSLTGGRKGTDD